MLFLRLIDYLTHFNIEHYFDYKTADLVSFKIGGNARLVIFPRYEKELVEILLLIKNNKFVILGKGTNCYFNSDYYDGIVVSTIKLSKIRVEKTNLICQCGASIASACKIARENSLSGLEFAYGIPGSIGGAVYINASAYGREFSSIIEETRALDLNSGEIVYLNNFEHKFGLKHSIFKDRALIILETKLSLHSAHLKDI